LRVTTELTGFRTLFSSYHNFRPEEGGAIIRDAMASHSGIGLVTSEVDIWLMTLE
jgi:hypothetical protein